MDGWMDGCRKSIFGLLSIRTISFHKFQSPTEITYTRKKGAEFVAVVFIIMVTWKRDKGDEKQ